MQTSRGRPHKRDSFGFDAFIDTERAKRQERKVDGYARVWGEMDDSAKQALFTECVGLACEPAVDADPALRARVEAIKAARKQGGNE